MENKAVVLFILIWLLATITSIIIVTECHPWCVLNMTDDEKICPRGYIAVDVISLKANHPQGRVVFCFFESRKFEILKDFEVNSIEEMSGKCYRGISNPSSAVWAIDVQMDEGIE